MDRYAPPTTPHFLMEEMRKVFADSAYYEGLCAEFSEREKKYPHFPLLALEHVLLHEPHLMPQVLHDWSVIQAAPTSICTGGTCNQSKQIKGFFVIPGGATLIGVELGNVELHPVYAVIYHDGYTFRGYIPQAGNVYNKDTKAAFGMDPEMDVLPYIRDYGEAKGLTAMSTQEVHRKILHGFFHPLCFSVEDIYRDITANIITQANLAA